MTLQCTCIETAWVVQTGHEQRTLRLRNPISCFFPPRLLKGTWMQFGHSSRLPITFVHICASKVLQSAYSKQSTQASRPKAQTSTQKRVTVHCILRNLIELHWQVNRWVWNPVLLRKWTLRRHVMVCQQRFNINGNFPVGGSNVPASSHLMVLLLFTWHCIPGNT